MHQQKYRQRPELGFWQIWNMCFGFLGVQFGFALQNANTSRIFQSLGAEMDDLPILWLAAPLTGLIVQPIIGYMSDHTWNKLGRRRPYFLIGALCTSVALILMPNSPTLWVAAGMLWIMDASINVTMEPFRAFVGDMLPKKQRPFGFLMQSFFIGVGAVVASALPWILSNFPCVDAAGNAVTGFCISSFVAEGSSVPDTVITSFYAGAIVLFISVVWTIVRTREYPPEQLEAYEQAEQELSQELSTADSPTNDSQTETAPYDQHKPAFGSRLMHILLLVMGLGFGGLISTFELDKGLYILAGMITALGLLLSAAHILYQRSRTASGFYQVMADMVMMPKTMQKLAIVQFFTWFGLFAMWIYTTPAVANYQYGVAITDGSMDTTLPLYNQAADWVGVLFASYNGFAAIAALIIPLVVKVGGLRKAHMINLFLGALGLISFFYVSDPVLLLISMVGIGFAWASTVSLPYAILTDVLPGNKLGLYMGIFNFFITIPQALAAAVLGFILVQFFNSEPIYILVLGGVCWFIAGLLTLTIAPAANRTIGH